MTELLHPETMRSVMLPMINRYLNVLTSYYTLKIFTYPSPIFTKYHRKYVIPVMVGKQMQILMRAPSFLTAMFWYRSKALKTTVERIIPMKPLTMIKVMHRLRAWTFTIWSRTSSGELHRGSI